MPICASSSARISPAGICAGKSSRRRRKRPSGASVGTAFAAAAGRPPPVTTKCRPSDIRGARSAAARIPRAAEASRTITVADVTIPPSCASRVPALTPGERPKSSALTISFFTVRIILQQIRRR